ncbi:hypothetical protein [Deefgea rivuli]|uniref:hypothetical protein n=1 Tax=Deefgea rivuli TaxID=400948 RepID=UPI0004871C75|nr:hypothetical protein [Deefgea rivuli]
MIDSYKPQVVNLLRAALLQKETVHYSQLYQIFDSVSPQLFGGENLKNAAIHKLLEEAGHDLAPIQEAIVTCVLRSKIGFPGLGFFDVFKNQRGTEYQAIAGGNSIQALTDDQKRQIVAIEYQRAYKYITQQN